MTFTHNHEYHKYTPCQSVYLRVCYSIFIDPKKRNSRPQLPHTVTYLVDNKQMVSEDISGQIHLLGANLAAPDVKWFPLLEAGKEGYANYLLVDVELLFPALKCGKFILVLTN